MWYRYVNELDKVELQAEHALSEKDLAKLGEHCRQVGQRPIQVKYHRRWTYCVWVVRPTRRCLELLRKLLKRATNGYKIYLVELARDFLISQPCLREALALVLVRSLTVLRRQLRVTYEKGTFYWGKRGPLSIALYVDRPKKGAKATDQPCVHIELRLRGIAQLRRFGLQTLAQLLDPGFDSAWSRVVNIVHVPRKKAVLGRLLGKREVSGTALRKRADAFIRRGAVVKAEEIFAIQNVKIASDRQAREERIHLPRSLPRSDFNVWCRTLRPAALI